MKNQNKNQKQSISKCQLLRGKGSRKEGKEGRTELVNGGKKKGRKWMNERVKEWVMNEYNILAVYQTPWASKERLNSSATRTTGLLTKVPHPHKPGWGIELLPHSVWDSHRSEHMLCSL